MPLEETAFDPELVKEFIAESEETLAKFSDDLLALEQSADDKELISSIFRAAHGLKGTSAMFGFNKISELTHEMEEVLDLARKGELTINKEIIDALLVGYDLSKQLIEEVKEQKESGADTKAVINLLHSVIREKQIAGDSVQINLENLSSNLREYLSANHLEDMKRHFLKGEKIYEVQLNLMESVESMDISPIAFFRMIDMVGDLVVSSSMPFAIPSLKDFTPTKNYFKLLFLITSTRGEKKIRELFTELVRDVTVKEIVCTVEGRENPSMLGEILVESGKITENDLNAALAIQKRESKSIISDTLRVDQNKIDLFMNLIGEQTIITNTVSRLGKRLKGKSCNNGNISEIDEIYNTSVAGERIIDQLQKSVLSIRMVPLKTVFKNLPRIIRDISSKTGKEFDFQVKGEDIELDKNIIDKLGDPLVHMIRNAADHGIEDRNIRIERGKPEKGSVRLAAKIDEKFVVIEITDDGAGINVEKIKKKAVENGVVSRDKAEQMDNHNAFMLIFEPGISSAKEITDISGRGVGMDIVMHFIRDIGGRIDVDSNLGSGTNISLTIPVNMGILEKMLITALIVEVERNQYALPIDGVVETIYLQRSEIDRVRNKNAICLRGEVLGVVDLTDIISSKYHDSDETDVSEFPCTQSRINADTLAVVIISNGKNSVGISVDRLIGQQSIVIKPLQNFLSDIKEIKGATILGDGRVILILNSEELIKRAAVGQVSSGKGAGIRACSVEH